MGEKEEIVKALKEYFDDLMKRKDVNVERVRWELDYIIYPGIGSFIASGVISKEEGKEIFEFCERKLKELRERFKA